MKFLLVIVCLWSFHGVADSPATEARLTYEHKQSGTDFRYDILVDRHTIGSMDAAIYRGSYLGAIHASQMDPEADLDERTDKRNEEIEQITRAMLGAIPDPKVPGHAPVHTRSFNAEPPIGPVPHTVPSLAPSLQKVLGHLDSAELAFETKDWEKGFHHMGELTPLMQSLKASPLGGENLASVRARWTELRGRYFVDGVLTTDGLAPISFTTQKDTLTGRVYRHFANLAVARQLGPKPLVVLAVLDEFKAHFSPALAKNFRAFLQGAPFEKVSKETLASLRSSDAWPRLVEAVGPMDPEMQATVLRGMADEFLKIRGMQSQGELMTTLLKQWVQESSGV